MPGITDHNKTIPSAERTYKITYIYRGSQKMSLAENNLRTIEPEASDEPASHSYQVL